MSKMLNFSASYQNGSSSQSATCSSLSDVQYNCTAEFTVDTVDTIKSLAVTVSGPYGSNSSTINPPLGQFLCTYIIRFCDIMHIHTQHQNYT